jgi:hypothetical protein
MSNGYSNSDGKLDGAAQMHNCKSFLTFSFKSCILQIVGNSFHTDFLRRKSMFLGKPPSASVIKAVKNYWEIIFKESS